MDLSFATTVLGIAFCAIHFCPIYATDHSNYNDPLPYCLLICGVAKNCAHSLQYVKESAEALGARFSDYRIVIYENNSKDQTPQILSSWLEDNPKLVAVSEVFSPERLEEIASAQDRAGRPCRYEWIAYARNRMLELAKRPEMPLFDFVVMADLDIPDHWPIERICAHVQRRDWDIMTSFGLDQHGLYYDYFALRDDRLPLGPEFLGDQWFRLRRPPQYLPKRASELIPIRSGFGGLALYRAGAILPFHFDAVVTPAMTAAAEQLLEQDASLRRLFEAWRGPNAPLIARNSNWTVPGVCCEHVPLCQQAIDHGFGKIYIDPEMVLYRFGKRN